MRAVFVNVSCPLMQDNNNTYAYNKELCQQAVDAFATVDAVVPLTGDKDIRAVFTQQVVFLGGPHQSVRLVVAFQDEPLLEGLIRIGFPPGGFCIGQAFEHPWELPFAHPVGVLDTRPIVGDRRRVADGKDFVNDEDSVCQMNSIGSREWLKKVVSNPEPTVRLNK